MTAGSASTTESVNGDRILVAGLFAAATLAGVLLHPLVAVPWFVFAWIVVTLRSNLAPHRGVAVAATVIGALLVVGKAALSAFT